MASVAEAASLKSSFVSSARCPSSANLRASRIRVSSAAASRQSKSRSLSVSNVASEPRTASLDSAPADPSDVVSVASSIKYHSTYTPTFSPEAAKAADLKAIYYATAQSIRDTLIQRLNETNEHFDKINPKEVAYLSMEFLQGRALLNALGNLDVTGPYAEALEKLGVKLEDVIETEPNAALGNGGLGRLASCFLDSIATLNLPGWGYGLRYKYGLFKQAITADGQAEFAEDWLETGYPWEVPRLDINYPIRFFGDVVEGPDGKKKWVGGSELKAVAYDLPIPGYKTKNTIALRLWQADVLASDFDLEAFNAGDHVRAAAAQADAAKICAVLYPGDGTTEGKLLRLKQQYMLCSASVQDILAQFEKRNGTDWSKLATKAAIQMNDTHPTLAAPELLRILIDDKGLSWDEAWKITTKVVAYTNHTVLPEALEKWSQELVKKLLPRHFEIIQKIDDQFIHEVVATYKALPKKELLAKIESMRILEGASLPEDVGLLLKEEEDTKEVTKKDDDIKLKPLGTVRMANLCVISGHAVNGVAAIHSEIVKDDVFNDFYQLWPEKFQNKTNGVTPRRWIAWCNPSLSAVITKWLGSDEWILDADKLKGLGQFADNEELLRDIAASKRSNKVKLAEWIKEKTGYIVSPDALFDIQVKRIHEYKRQLLNILGIVYRYKKMKEMSPEERKAKFVPRVCLFGGKAFATYTQAKRIVRFIVDVGKIVNNDPEIGDLLKVVFVPDYNVSVAEVLIPASELSEHISTAGMEASGTSNMKFAMNGCLLIGTLDGANVEIREEVGEDNFFLFGARAEEIVGLRKERAEGKFVPDPRFEEVKAYIRSGVFGPVSYDEMIGSLEGNEGYGRADYFLVGHDFPAYIECQDKVDIAYRDQLAWTKASLMNTANSGFFSSDRTIKQYAEEIWDISPAPVS